MHTDATRRRGAVATPAGLTTAEAGVDNGSSSSYAMNPEAAAEKKKLRKRVGPAGKVRRGDADGTSLFFLYLGLGILGIFLLLAGKVRKRRFEVLAPITSHETVSTGGEEEVVLRRTNRVFQFESGGRSSPTNNRGRDRNGRREAARREAAYQKYSHGEFKPKHIADPSDVGDKSPRFLAIQDKYRQIFPQDSDHDAERAEYVKTVRKHDYVPIEMADGSTFDNILDCPDEPPADYPRTYRTMDIINHWNPDDVTPPSDSSIYQGICVFHHDKPGDVEKALRYREAEVPFVMRDDPSVLRTVQRWNHPDYLREVLNNEPHRAEFSHDNHFMYWQRPRTRDTRQNLREEGWKPPTEMLEMTYDDWLSKANTTDRPDYPNEADHWYFRLIGCGMFSNCDKIISDWLFNDLDFFFPRKNLYMVTPSQQKGIHCRFGMKGVIAENHFDGSRNSIVVLGGERRYILTHPDECHNLALYPKEHPSARHSAVDWSQPDLKAFPEFSAAQSNEIVLQAGDVLYLPTNWFHFIVSLGLNFQCNTRSGISEDYMKPIRDCGFPV